MICIAHRLFTLKRADHILVLGQGQILEEGGFQELATKPQGHFARMVELQDTHDHKKQTKVSRKGGPARNFTISKEQKRKLLEAGRQFQNKLLSNPGPELIEKLPCLAEVLGALEK